MRSNRFLTASALATASFSIPQAVWAQAAEPVTTQTTEQTVEEGEVGADGQEATDDGDVVVTGSRIRRNQFNSPDPVVLITRDEATSSGFNSTAEILQSSSVTGGTDQINDSYGGFVVNGGPGVNTVGLRGLGPQRTLILLDGRRVAPAGARGSVGSADLNVLPNALIDRVEVLGTGASSVYGSDAVAGVINILTRNNVRGLNAEAQHNILGYGDGNSYRYSLVGGLESNGFSIVGSVEYYKRETLKLGDIPWAQCPTAMYGVNGNFGAGDFVDPATGQPKCFPLENGGVTVNTIGTTNVAGNTVALAPGVAAGYTGVCNRFRPRAGAGGRFPGYECVGGGTLNTNIRDTFDPTMLQEDVISPAEIYTGYLKTAYESNILGNAEFYVDLLLNRRKSSQAQHRQFSLDYPVNSPLLPPELRTGTFLGPQAQVPYSTGLRVFASYGIYDNYQTVDFARLNGGVRGELPLDNWRYDFFVGKSWSDTEYTSDLILADRLAQSFDVVASGSGFACRNTVGGCVAAPALSADVVGGRFRNLPWFDYVTDPITGTTKFRETTVAFTIDGPVFRLPAGDVQIVLGAERRNSSIDDTPAPDSQRNNLYGFTSSTVTRGSDSVIEGFGEIEIPLLRDQLIHNLTLNGSARYTEYESYGGDWTYKVGGVLSPVRGLTFRGSYGTSYRAPALFEQFLGATSSFLGNTNDPCNERGPNTNPLITAQCREDGLPDDFRQNSSISVIGVGGAEAGLEAETSKAFTAGGVIEPRFGESFGQLSFAADYFNIKIENGVAQLTAANVLSQCYANPLRTTCDTGLITREPFTGPGSGRLTVIQSFVNISDSKVEGIDFTLRYAREIGAGQFRIGGSATMFLERYNRTFPTSAITDVIGFVENPKWTGVFDASYEIGAVYLRYGVEWTDATDSTAFAQAANPAFTAETRKFRTDDYFLHTATMRYEFDKFGFTFGVRNIFDTKPPMISADLTTLVAGNAPLYSGYDLRGRQFFISARAGF